MPWSLGSVRIYVQELGGEVDQILPRLQPLNGGTITQIYGYVDESVGLKGLVVGSGDLSTLKSYTTSGVEFLLTSPEGSLGSYFVKNVKSSRSEYVYQYIRLDMDCLTPVYQVDVTLFKD